MTTTTQRGYGYHHKQTRKAWAPAVATGQVECTARICLLEPERGDRYIDPTDPWDLGHTDDRTAYDGPQHETCNRSDGARRQHQKRRARRARRRRMRV